ncbi:MAG: RNA 2',3'-cyclic phosphodiesterase [Bacillota bacterium]
MTNLRLFWAINLPVPARAYLGDMISRLRSVPADVKWVEEQNLHLTVKFLGDVPANRIALLTAAVKDAASGAERFSLSIQGLGFFPAASRPRVMWAGLTGDLDKLKKLRRQVEGSLVPLGFAPEDKRFLPHLTLARFRSVRGTEELTGLAGQLAVGTAWGPVVVKELDLMESKLTSQGPVYTVLDKIGLK